MNSLPHAQNAHAQKLRPKSFRFQIAKGCLCRIQIGNHHLRLAVSFSPAVCLTQIQAMGRTTNRTAAPRTSASVSLQCLQCLCSKQAAEFDQDNSLPEKMRKPLAKFSGSQCRAHQNESAPLACHEPKHQQPYLESKSHCKMTSCSCRLFQAKGTGYTKHNTGKLHLCVSPDENAERTRVRMRRMRRLRAMRARRTTRITMRCADTVLI